MEWRVGEEEEDSERGKERMVVVFFFKKQTVRKVEGIKNKAGSCFVLK